LISKTGKQVRLQADEGEWRIEAGLFSAGYGLKEKTNRVIYCFNNMMETIKCIKIN